MLHVLILFSLIVVLIYVLERYYNRDTYDAEKQFPGPKGYWYLGNVLDYAVLDSKGLFDKTREDYQRYGDGRFYRVTAFGFLNLLTRDYRDMEVILGSNTQIDKGEEYQFIIPWIGYGLLTSTGSRWKKHRRIITPTFHFKILEQFVDIFNRNGAIMCEKLEKEVDGEPFNIYNYVNLAALDSIYESAMGVNMNVQKNSETNYVKAVKEMCNLATHRMFNWFLRIDPVFRLTKFQKIQEEKLNILHSTTENLIKQRRKELNIKKEIDKNENKPNEEDDFNQKKRMAFLDLLLESADESNLTDKDIREEVDTFMFEGHDTISSGVSFALWALANNPDVQEKVYQEQYEMFGDSDTPPTLSDLQNMKYLDMTLKESQRLYPSVPMISRLLNDRVDLAGGYYLPKGANITLDIIGLHRNEKFWTDPEKFNPENFSPEAVRGRHPYCYVPFSAGPRNCIGQKYAVLEMKATVSKVIRKYKLLPSPYEKHKLQLTDELVLMSLSGTHIKIERRKKTSS